MINFMIMGRIFAIFVGAMLACSARAQQTVIADPNAQLRPVKGYHGVRVSSAINLYLSQGQEEKVVVSAKDVKLRDRIVTEVVDGILVIRLDVKPWHRLGNNKLKAYVSFTALDQISASGASDVYVDGVISGDRLSLDLSGASDFKGAIKVNELLLDQTGASDSQITGQVGGQATIRTSGASDVKAYDLVVDNCSVHASGASDVRITVNRQLDADLSGASSVYYKGEGVIRESHSSGASEVAHKG
ncbi:MAG TPA: head GIN domain-containing protein [Puia sp.]|nr:head GIN domain-containing protein [Puia sp.]